MLSIRREFIWWEADCLLVTMLQLIILRTTFLGVDTEVLSLSGKQGDSCDPSSASWHTDTLRQSDSPHSSCNSEASLRLGNSQMNSQMAASWVGQSGIMMNSGALQNV
ncbi:hypothetical protein SAY87_026320 [Trapa incisa]|uniref:Uncharacterized protein n=1 Tax=Trapa incisa TaxID=236973 RepID=A0AAN7GLX6_9MYRT|nr:hypothetical protein SAY87_026320 [Trapa incisa]